MPSTRDGGGVLITFSRPLTSARTSDTFTFSTSNGLAM